MRRVFAGARQASMPGCLVALALSTTAEAQPAPSFRSSCQDLRASIAKLDPGAEDYFTVEVVGTLRDVQSDGVLAYMMMCSPPDPQVLCVTYMAGDRRKGDSVILAGTYSQRGTGSRHARPVPSPFARTFAGMMMTSAPTAPARRRS